MSSGVHQSLYKIIECLAKKCDILKEAPTAMTKPKEHFERNKSEPIVCSLEWKTPDKRIILYELMFRL